MGSLTTPTGCGSGLVHTQTKLYKPLELIYSVECVTIGGMTMSPAVSVLSLATSKESSKMEHSNDELLYLRLVHTVA